jgi:hypothetical protein
MLNLSDLGKWLAIIGVVLAVLGGALWLLGKFTPLGSLPGDIRIQQGNFGCFIPLGTMLLLSLIATVLLNLLARIMNK